VGGSFPRVAKSHDRMRLGVSEHQLRLREYRRQNGRLCYAEYDGFRR
jgi:hypothetical protein